MVAYDEFSLFRDNADEAGLRWHGEPEVHRVSTDLSSGRRISALVWGDGPPELVLIHGGAQNAHTWDTVALALGRPLVAVDLPGHGHSDWWPDHDYAPQRLAAAVAEVLSVLAPDAELVCGMSLGGLTAICLAAEHPELVRRLAVVDVTPGADHVKAEPIIAFISGPETFESFEAMLARTIEHNPGRSESSLRRGVLHNARENPDGTWSWRWDPVRGWKLDASEEAAGGEPRPDFRPLWGHVERVQAPLVLYAGGDSGVIDDGDIAELRRRQPTAQVIVVEGAGHSIQGDKPVELASHLEAFLRS